MYFSKTLELKVKDTENRHQQVVALAKSLRDQRDRFKQQVDGKTPIGNRLISKISKVMFRTGAKRVDAKEAGGKGKSDSIEAHTKTESLRLHKANLNDNNEFVHADEWINLEDEPDHQELCNREQRYFLKAITEDIDLTDHVEDAVNSLRIAFACDESVRSGKVVML